MATVIRAEISERNTYWISKHRHYELKHFCLQYKDWKKAYAEAVDNSIRVSNIDPLPGGTGYSNLTEKCAIEKAHYANRIKMVEAAAMDADKDLYIYILKAVTEGLSYSYLKSRLEMPCSKDTYYDRFRRFYWLLDKTRG